MDMNFDFEPVYPRHDLMIEISEVEMAMDCMDDCDESLPDMESRMNSLLEALDHLCV